jgi:hypothetical protein
VHEGEPDVRCELPGAFAELKLSLVGVYVPGATLAKAGTENAMTAPSGTAKRKRIRRSMLVFPLIVVGYALPWHGG